jgi:hypothetical protein
VGIKPWLGAVLLWSATAAARVCEWKGKPSERWVVDVQPKGVTPFKIALTGVPIVVRPEGVGQPSTVEVQGALAFRGTAEEVPVRTARAVDLNGMLDLPAGIGGFRLHRLVSARLVDGELQMGDLTFRGLMVPCDALTLSDVAAPGLVAVDEEQGDLFRPAAATLHLRSGPGRGAAVELAITGKLEAFALRRTEEAGEWWRVRTRWPDGSELTAWVRKGELVAAPRRAGDLFDATGGLSCPGEADEPAGSQVATAPVAPGTQVYGARYLGPWGKVVDGQAITVRFRQKDDWVELLSVPGLAGVGVGSCAARLGDAWVPRAAVKLPTP